MAGRSPVRATRPSVPSRREAVFPSCPPAPSPLWPLSPPPPPSAPPPARPPPHSPGRIAESVVGATLGTIARLDLAHLPGRAGGPEVDFVLTVGARRIPLEVRYQRRIEPLADTEGLRTFLEKSANQAPFGILVSQTD